MKEHRAPISAFKQQTTTNRDTDEDKLGKSSRIRSKQSDWSKLLNSDDNIDDEKLVLSDLSKYNEDTGHRTGRKDFRVVWRYENLYRLLIKESLLIQAYKPELNRTTHSVPWIVFSDGKTTDFLPDINIWKCVLSPFLTPSIRCLLCVSMQCLAVSFFLIMNEIDRRNVKFSE
jgi:hypothetical protein